MSRVRVSTTVDGELLAAARRVNPQGTDSSLLEAALQALLANHRRAGIDASYRTAYDERPLDAADEWGDLASWRTAVGAS